MPAPLSTPIAYLKGVGPQRAELLKKELSIFTYADLLQHFPFRYVDRSQFHKAGNIQSDAAQIQLRGTLHDVKLVGQPRRRRLTAKFKDDSGSIELVWFKGARWIQPTLKEGQEYVAFGKPNFYRGKANLPHPELELAATWQQGPNAIMQPVYSTTEKLAGRGLNSRGIWALQKTLLPQLKGHIHETLTDELRNWLGGMSRENAYLQIHAPTNSKDLDIAIRTLKFEELLYIQLMLLKQKVLVQQSVQGNVFASVGDHFNTFFKEHIPFELTGAQKRVVKEIRRDMGSGKQMNRLLQGDVGSGKTLVGLLCMLIALDNGFQAALMAPTEILAQQHFKTLSNFLKDMPLEVRLLTGSTKTAERKSLFTALKTGHIHILVGTHALLEDKVKFRQLGLVVIDEQHRFGVAQRAKLWKKNTTPPHVLVMTATPIPRTLAMTVYGDLDVSVIDELPPGRKAIKTVHRYDSSRNAVLAFMEDEIKKGRQIYVVYPLVKESEKLDLKYVTDGFESMVRRFPLPDYAVSIVHGQMPVEDKDFEMARFVKGDTDIMVATTVIEVGVDVPNASVMVIENAERFGLSQLHQLRGRVGRGADQSFCILMTGAELGNTARKRIKTMCESNDGFHISEVDMELRGPGEIMGTQQSGMPELQLANLLQDGELLQQARRAAMRLLDEDPELSLGDHAVVGKELTQRMKDKAVWGRIS